MRRRRTRPLAARAMAWLRANLFSGPGDTATTLLVGALAAWGLAHLIDWAILSATFTADSGKDCARPGAGACWAFIDAKLKVFLYGRYPEAELWRVNATYALGLAGLVPLMLPGVPGKAWLALYMLLVFPVAAFVLLTGGLFGLEPVATELWGGLLVTLVVACVGIAASFPLAILLALARRSGLPIIAWTATIFIELVRGIPLITVLFFSSVMLPLFLPDGVTLDKLLRALVGVTLFSAAYLAEVVRGGLQAIPRGQYEAADALGLAPWQKMGFVILPQALRIVLPGIVNSFIALFKDTSLVLIIGLFDLLGAVQQAVASDATWFSPQTALTGYVFAGAVFWAISFGMSRYSAWLEKRLDAGARR
ncbi:MAG: amino acid ABC transporter permease [Hyphomicrobiaceae bacterium]|nr:amino acid ABC transporter permease [Hyphomicrobiaceae bacterium]